MNRVIIAGYVGRDPEAKTYGDDGKLVKFSVATSEKRGGEDQTEWHNIVAFNRQAEVIEQYVKKGSYVLVEGRIQTRSWENDDGEKKYMTEIILDRFEFGPKTGGDSAPTSSTAAGAPF